MTDLDELKILLEKKERLVAMVAPSFPIMYGRSEIISKLKALGFEFVVEVSAGAKKTNEAVSKLLKENPQSRFITSPCASFVRYVRTKHPEMLKYLAFQADSPMVATAKIVHEKFPNYRPVFVGPCIVKKLEASEDYPELKMVVITYKELEQLLKEKKLQDVSITQDAQFDIEEKHTRIYPFDGGLTESGGIRNILKDEEIRIVSSYKNCEMALKEFTENKTIRFVDILFCEGGCINGPGVQSSLSIQDRKKKIQEYAQ
ncbi:MAG: [Fe-Fe] hydrogenase large subunit C-terminal domain-containing protein [Microgenomates group bacterium]